MGTNATSGQFEQVEVSKNLSQLIRSNTPHYWTYMKHRADLIPSLRKSDSLGIPKSPEK
jgi:hypothetical protein